MTVYDFNTVHQRKGTHSIKWEFNRTMFGSDDLLPLWVADMDFACPPAVTEAVQQRAAHGIYGYTGISDAYLQSVVTWMQQRHQWTISPEWIVFINGVVPALNMLLQTFSHPGDAVVIQPPVYYPFFNAINNNGRHPLLNTLKEENGRYVMDLEDLGEKLKNPRTSVMILCSPHNPVGRVWSRSEISRVAELCLAHDVLLISDEIHHDLVFPPHQHQVTAMLSDEIARNTITCTAPSKTFNLAGLQASNIIISDEKKRRRFTQTLERNGVFGINPFGSVATIAAYESGGPWLDALLKYLTENLDYLEGFVKEHLPEVRVFRPEGTYLVWMDFRSLGLDQEALEALIEKDAGVALNQGYIFGSSGSGFQRLNVACPRQLLEEGLNRIARAVANLRG